MNLREAIENCSLEKKKNTPGSPEELAPIKYLPWREAKKRMEISVKSI